MFLVSVMLLSSMLLVALVASSGTTMLVTEDGIEENYFAQAREYADACVRLIQLRLSLFAFYGGNETISEGNIQCIYGKIIHLQNIYTVMVSTVYVHVPISVETKFDSSQNFLLISKRVVAGFPP